MDNLIALGQVEVLYFSPGYVEQEEKSWFHDPKEYWPHEYVPKDSGDSIWWRITNVIDEYYPEGFMEIVDGNWEDESEFIYTETMKIVPTHRNLEIKSGLMFPTATGRYKPVETYDRELHVRFPVILKADFDVDSYDGEVDISYWMEGVPDLNHLEDLLPEKKSEQESG